MMRRVIGTLASATLADWLAFAFTAFGIVSLIWGPWMLRSFVGGLS